MRIKDAWRTTAVVFVFATVAAACGAESEAREAEAGEQAAEAGEPRLTVPAGTTMSLTLDGELSTRNSQVGDRFTATVSGPVVRDDRVVIPQGAKVTGRVKALRTASGDSPARIDVEFESIDIRGESHDLAASLTGAEVATDKEMTGEAKKIGGGAAAGALVGGLIGGGAKSALAGAAVGAAAGTGITMATRTEHAVLPSGSTLTIKLDESVRVRAGS